MKLYAIGNSINPKNFNQDAADKLNDDLENILVFKTKKAAEAQAKKMGTKRKQVPVFEIEVSDRVKFDKLQKNDDGIALYDGRYDIVSASLKHFDKAIDVVTFDDVEEEVEVENDEEEANEEQDEEAEENQEEANDQAPENNDQAPENNEQAQASWWSTIKAFPGKVKAQFDAVPAWAKWTGTVGVAAAGFGLLGGAPVVLAVAAKLGITATLSPVATVVASLVGGAATTAAGFIGFKATTATVNGVKAGYAAGREYFRKRSAKELYIAELHNQADKYQAAVEKLYGEKAKASDKNFVEVLADMVNHAPERQFKADGAEAQRQPKNNKVVVFDFARKAIETAAAETDARKRSKIERDQLAEATKLGFRK